MAAADKAREAHRLVNLLHQACAKNGRPREVDDLVAEMRVLFPNWTFLPVMGVGVNLYIPYDAIKRVPMGVGHVAQRIEAIRGDGRSFVVKARDGAHDVWLDEPSYKGHGVVQPVMPVMPTVWDRLGKDDFGE